jgi:hypothetical protein
MPPPKIATLLRRFMRLTHPVVVAPDDPGSRARGATGAPGSAGFVSETGGSGPVCKKNDGMMAAW